MRIEALGKKSLVDGRKCEIVAGQRLESAG